MSKKSTYHHGNLREALILASMEIVAREGVDRLTMAQAAKSVGVSSGAPYRHFQNREELLREVSAAVSSRLNRNLAEASQSAPTPADAFLEAGIAFVAWAAKNPRWFQILMDPEYTDFNAEHGEEGESFWRVLSERFNSGALQENDPLLGELAGRSLAYGLGSLFASGVFEQLGIGSDDAPELARRVLAALS